MTLFVFIMGVLIGGSIGYVAHAQIAGAISLAETIDARIKQLIGSTVPPVVPPPGAPPTAPKA